MTFQRLTPVLLPITLVSCLLLAAGCASSGPAPAPEAPSAPVAPTTSVFLVGQDGLIRRSDTDPAMERIRMNVTFGGLYVMRPGSKDVAIALRNETGTQLGLLAADGSFRIIHEYAGATDYSAAWSPDGKLAFGYAAPGGRGIGVMDADGEVSAAGCSASSRALGWAGDDRLVVADANNRYVVGASGCKTLSRVDSRKLHEAAFNPTRPLVAYVLRELEYDRAARQYVPDSSLYVSELDGSNPILIAGNRYRPHRPVWSPDGSELAFDTRLPDQPDRRLISIHDIERKESAYLNPSSLDAPVNEWDAHWSPSGSSIAYMQKYGDADPAVIVRPMNGSFTALVGESGERFGRWIDDNHLVVTDGSAERLVSINGSTSIKGPAGATILRID